MEDIIYKRISETLSLPLQKIKGTGSLLDEGNTIPFITRYRKEATGGLDEQQIQQISDQLEYQRNLEKRKEEIREKIEEQGKWTQELAQQVNNATQLKILEDLYLPFRPKRRTKASVAKEKGLEPLANIIFANSHDDPSKLALNYIDKDKELETIELVIAGALDIVAEAISENAEIRALVRDFSFKRGYVCVKKVEKTEDVEQIYKDYYEYDEKVMAIPPHRILAIDRGEKAKVLRVKLDLDIDEICDKMCYKFIYNEKAPTTPYLEEAIMDSYKRLIAPAIEREVRNDLTAKAHQHAIEVFAENVRNLLMQPPLSNLCILAIDPGYVSGCKLAVISAMGDLLEHGVMFPHSPQNKKDAAKQTLRKLCKKYPVNAIVIGNGTACRETEELIADVIQEDKSSLVYTIVSEAGASVYSASKEARDEFPDLDASYRGTVSIGRRMLDPLAELVKIDPKSLGVGLYQHDVDGKQLDKALERVVSSCVNYVGVDINRASAELLRYVAGVNQRIAKNIIKKRKELGKFSSRNEIKSVSGIGAGTFTQCAGFLRIQGGDNPFDETAIHPESYKICEKLLVEIEAQKNDLRKDLQGLSQKVAKLKPEEVASKLEVGTPTMRDIFANLTRPGRDPREELPQPIFRKGILTLEDLEPDMILQGTVRNVVDFGAFIDIGVKADGLVHVSQMANSFVKNPMDICKIGDNVEVKIMSVDKERKRISLSMII